MLLKQWKGGKKIYLWQVWVYHELGLHARQWNWGFTWDQCTQVQESWGNRPGHRGVVLWACSANEVQQQEDQAESAQEISWQAPAVPNLPLGGSWAPCWEQAIRVLPARWGRASSQGPTCGRRLELQTRWRGRKLFGVRIEGEIKSSGQKQPVG